jgi:hypothetical protein
MIARLESMQTLQGMHCVNCAVLGSTLPQLALSAAVRACQLAVGDISQRQRVLLTTEAHARHVGSAIIRHRAVVLPCVKGARLASTPPWLQQLSVATAVLDTFQTQQGLHPMQHVLPAQMLASILLLEAASACNAPLESSQMSRLQHQGVIHAWQGNIPTPRVQHPVWCARPVQ